MSNRADSNADMICKGVVRLEMVPNSADYIEAIIDRVKPKYLTQAYKVEEWTSGDDFLAQVGLISAPSQSYYHVLLSLLHKVIITCYIIITNLYHLQVCKKTGKLLKKGEPDMNTVAKMIFNDFMRGRLPYFNVPPNSAKQQSDKQSEKLPTG